MPLWTRVWEVLAGGGIPACEQGRTPRMTTFATFITFAGIRRYNRGVLDLTPPLGHLWAEEFWLLLLRTPVQESRNRAKLIKVTESGRIGQSDGIGQNRLQVD